MSLFGKKKEEKCCCGCIDPKFQKIANNQAGVKVLGTGCAKCNELEVYVREALAELGMDTSIDHVTDFTQIAAFGVISTPALVIDGKVVSYGKVLKKDEIVQLLLKIRG